MQNADDIQAIQGYWHDETGYAPAEGEMALQKALWQVEKPVFLVNHQGRLKVATQGQAELLPKPLTPEPAYPLLAHVPPLSLERLGDPGFKHLLGLRYPYVAGAMANGITSVAMVEAAARAGMIGFFGAAGLAPEAVEQAIDQLQENLGQLPFGMNLIHSSGDAPLEKAIVDLYLRKQIRLISASAYMRLTPYLVLYRVKGIHTTPEGEIVVPNKIVAKVSRTEVATRFFSPPPEKLLRQLHQEQLLSDREVELAARIPMADALTAEADSGGHTDNRPALALFPTMLALRDEICARHQYPRPIAVGLGGGVATPAATAAAFAMGAAYVVTGSVNQSCREAGVSDHVKQMLAAAGQADVTMAPAADMFEMGGQVQVLKRGTMFAMRAAKLYDLYTRYNRFEDLPDKDRRMVEEKILRRGFAAEWEATRNFFARRDPRQIERAENDPRHKMALVFRSYLGRSSRWGVIGEESRQVDYQIWCGPAIGAFNEWARGSFLEDWTRRDLVTVALNLLWGAAVTTRLAGLRNQGLPVSPAVSNLRPLPLNEINAYLTP